jgi:hypothetical protein
VARIDAQILKELADKRQHKAAQKKQLEARRAMTPYGQRLVFNISWALARIGQLLEEQGTQNALGEWRVVTFQETLGAKIERPKR